MSDLIKVDESGKITAKELYQFLELNPAHYSRWTKTNIENDDFYQAGVDWEGFTTMVNGNETKDYRLTIDFAKHLCMLSRSERGKQARNYFVEVEKRARQKQALDNVTYLIPKTFSQALQLATNLQLQIEEQAPKVLFAECVATSPNSVLIGELAKIIKQNGVDIGQNRLFEWLRGNGYLGKSGNNHNLPTQKSMDLGLFEIKKTVVTHSSGAIETKRTAKVTGKGQIYFVSKFVSKKDDYALNAAAES